MLNPKAIAVQGVGYGKLAVATLGFSVFLAIELPPTVVPEGANFRSYDFTRQDLRRQIKASFTLPSAKVLVRLSEPDVLARSTFALSSEIVKVAHSDFEFRSGSTIQLVQVKSSVHLESLIAVGGYDLSDEELVTAFLAVLDA